jgi:hypothetical protein
MPLNEWLEAKLNEAQRDECRKGRVSDETRQQHESQEPTGPDSEATLAAVDHDRPCSGNNNGELVYRFLAWRIRMRRCGYADGLAAKDMSGEFGSLHTPTARKQHKCEWCFGPIPKGEKHKQFSGMWQGDFQNWRMHDECYETSAGAQAEGFTPGEGEMPARVFELIEKSKEF